MGFPRHCHHDSGYVANSCLRMHFGSEATSSKSWLTDSFLSKTNLPLSKLNCNACSGPRAAWAAVDLKIWAEKGKWGSKRKLWSFITGVILIISNTHYQKLRIVTKTTTIRLPKASEVIQKYMCKYACIKSQYTAKLVSIMESPIAGSVVNRPPVSKPPSASTPHALGPVSLRLMKSQFKDNVTDTQK